MAGSSYGTLFKLTTFGESHGYSLGGIIEGFPAGFLVDIELVQQELSRRRPGQSAIVTQRKESDHVQFLSGIFEGKTTGTPIAFQVVNENHKSGDYDHLKDVFKDESSFNSFRNMTYLTNAINNFMFYLFRIAGTC